VHGRKFSLGLTLVELMVSLALGLFIFAVTLKLYVDNKGTYNLQRALSLMQEQGRYAEDLLAAQMKLSGFGGAQGVVNSFVFSSNSDGEPYDVLEIQIAGAGTDCMGGPLQAGSGVKRKRFYVKAESLLCSDSDGISAPIINNVESFQVAYGVDLDRSALFDVGYGSADIYVAGNVLEAEVSPHVVSVKIAIVVKSEQKINSGKSAVSGNRVWVLDRFVPDRFTASPDGYLRRLFVSTTAIRNFVHR